MDATSTLDLEKLITQQDMDLEFMDLVEVVEFPEVDPEV